VLIGSWIDPFNGIPDIKNKILRPTTDKFKEDPVRLLRAARFLARYGDFNHSVDLFEMGAQLQNSGELSSLVPDRVWAETQKALTEDHPHKYFMFLQNFKFPFSDFLTDMLNTVENNAYHRESSVFKHTMMVLEEASKHKDPVINFAALMHDMGKYICYYQYGNAHGHDIEGIPLIKDFCNKWKVPNDYRDSAIITCEQHQKVHSCMGRSTNSWSRPKSIMKMFEQSSAINKPERFKKMLLVCEADNVGRLCDDPKEDYKQSSYLSECLDAVISLDTKSISAKMLEDGKNGKLIGEAIRVARINEIRKVQNKWKEIK
jgi:tRNA nucleotidyltransferase (CCA-adding enzyme)